MFGCPVKSLPKISSRLGYDQEGRKHWADYYTNDSP